MYLHRHTDVFYLSCLFSFIQLKSHVLNIPVLSFIVHYESSPFYPGSASQKGIHTKGRENNISYIAVVLN